MKKRTFIKKASAATVLTTLGISLDSCNPNSIPEPDSTPSTGPILIDITQPPFTDLQNDQGWAIDTSNNILLVNIDGTISALTSVCTHARCTTDWEYANEQGIFTCRCHNSMFSVDGNVVSGPANAPLTVYAVSRDGDLLTINR